MQWEYQKILLNEHHRRGDDLDLLCAAGERGWKLVTITPNNVAYLKREILRDRGRAEFNRQQNHAMRAKYHNPYGRDLVGARSHGNLAQEKAGCRRRDRAVPRLASTICQVGSAGVGITHEVAWRGGVVGHLHDLSQLTLYFGPTLHLL